MLMRRFGLAGFVALWAVGCGDPAGTGGAGGGASTSTASTGGSKCTAMDVSACPTPSNECEQAVCDPSGACQVGPKGAHAACAGTPPAGAGVCDGAAACVGCIDPTDCPKAGGIDQLCVEKACVPKCVNGMCDAGKYCDTATDACLPVEPQGTACTESGQCASGHCVDGFCCDTACDTACVACAAAETKGADGTCGTVSCAGNPDGAVCLESKDKCGCTVATEATDCAAFPATPHCAASGPVSDICSECNTNAQCANHVKGHICGADFSAFHDCGCATDVDCVGIAGKTHCATQGANVFVCSECNTNAHCALIGNNNFCGDGSGGTTANVCGCKTTADCLNGTTCNGSHVCM